MPSTSTTVHLVSFSNLSLILSLKLNEKLNKFQLDDVNSAKGSTVEVIEVKLDQCAWNHIRVMDETVADLLPFTLRSRHISTQFVDLNRGIGAALEELIQHITRGGSLPPTYALCSIYIFVFSRLSRTRARPGRILQHGQARQESLSRVPQSWPARGRSDQFDRIVSGVALQQDFRGIWRDECELFCGSVRQRICGLAVGWENYVIWTYCCVKIVVLNELCIRPRLYENFKGLPRDFAKENWEGFEWISNSLKD